MKKHTPLDTFNEAFRKVSSLNMTPDFTFQINKSAFVNLEIFNPAGEKVITLINKELPAGTFIVNFDPKNLSSGTYYYTLRVAGSESGEKIDFMETKKMIFLK